MRNAIVLDHERVYYFLRATKDAQYNYQLSTINYQLSTINCQLLYFPKMCRITLV